MKKRTLVRPSRSKRNIFHHRLSAALTQAHTQTHKRYWEHPAPSNPKKHYGINRSYEESTARLCLHHQLKTLPCSSSLKFGGFHHSVKPQNSLAEVRRGGRRRGGVAGCCRKKPVRFGIVYTFLRVVKGSEQKAKRAFLFPVAPRNACAVPLVLEFHEIKLCVRTI